MSISNIQNTAGTYALKKSLEIHNQMLEILPAPPGDSSTTIQKMSMAEVTGKGSVINLMG